MFSSMFLRAWSMCCRGFNSSPMKINMNMVSSPVFPKVASQAESPSPACETNPVTLSTRSRKELQSPSRGKEFSRLLPTSSWDPQTNRRTLITSRTPKRLCSTLASPSPGWSLQVVQNPQSRLLIRGNVSFLHQCCHGDAAFTLTK